MKVLIPHTRELCYYSGTFFLKKIAETLESDEVSVSFFELSDEDADYNILETVADEGYDCIIDINSKLPYLIMDDGRPFLDSLKIPFFNYILDHPLYHAPGLGIPLKNYHAIAIDRYHQAFMQGQFEHLQSVTYLPMPGTKASKEIPFEDRKNGLVFSGTYEMEDSILYDIRDKGQLTYDVSLDMISLMDDLDYRAESALDKVLIDRFSSIEDGLQAFGFDRYYMLLNHLCRADKYVRFKRRRETIEALGQAGIPMTVFGSGWELMDIDRFKNISTRPHMTIAVSFEILANSRLVLDINPLFAAGLHDRVTTAMANNCVCLTDMGLEATPYLADNVNIVTYSTHDKADLIEKIDGLMSNQTRAFDIATAGRKIYDERLNWQFHARNLYDILSAAL